MERLSAAVAPEGSPEATRALDDARAIVQAQAGKIADPVLRESYLAQRERASLLGVADTR